MRILKLTLMAASVLALGAATASASSIDVIWQVSGTGTTTVLASSTITGNVVFSVGISDTPINSTGAVIEISADINGAGNTIITGYPIATLSLWTWLAYPFFPFDNTHLENLFAQGDATAMNNGQDLAAGTSTIIGTITVHAATNGQVLVSTNNLLGITGGAGGDDIFGNTTSGSLVSEFTFGGGTIIVPEPTVASLLGLGLLALTVVGRQRKL